MHRAALTAAVLLLATATAPAQAQAQAPPADAAVVAGPTASGLRLVAWDRGAQLCTAITGRDDDGSGARCLRGGTGVLSTNGVHGVVTPAGATAVELRFRRASVTVPTTAGEAYRGRFAGRVRFALGQHADETPWLLRYLDEAGRAIGADEGSAPAPLRGAPLVLASGRVGSRRYQLRAQARPVLAPLPGQRDRLADEVCLVITGAAGASESNSCLRRPLPPSVPLLPSIDLSCGRTTVLLQTSANVARAQALLGDGRRVTIPLRDLPARLGVAGRAGGLVIRGRVAIRRIVATNRAGGLVRVLRIASPPASPCSAGDSGGVLDAFFGLDDFLRQTGAPTPVVADDGVDLCIALGDLDPGRHCAPPPVDPDDSLVATRRAGADVLLFGAVPAQVTTIDLPGGRRVETAPGAAGYAGRYRDDVRFFTASLPAGAAAAVAFGSIVLRDSSGFAIGEADALAPWEYEADAVRLPGVKSRVSVAPMRIGRATALCLTGSDIPPFLVGPSCAPILIGDGSEADVVAVVSCAPRRATLFLRANRRARARLTDGRSVSSRVVTVPAGPERGTRLRVIDVPAGAGVRDVITASSRARLDLLPATRQCGYASGPSSVTTQSTARAEAVPD